MNIFWLSWRPRTAAAYMHDRHVVKIVLEVTQLLYTALHTLLRDRGHVDCAEWMAEHGVPRVRDGTRRGYAPTHANHPLAVWARATPAQTRMTIDVGLAISAEYQHRFGREHACHVHLAWFRDHLETLVAPLWRDPSSAQTPAAAPPACMPAEYVVRNRKGHVDVRLSYLRYYTSEPAKARLCLANYRRAPMPDAIKRRLPPTTHPDPADTPTTRPAKRARGGKVNARSTGEVGAVA